MASNWFDLGKIKDLFDFGTVKVNTTDDKSIKKIEKGLDKNKSIIVTRPTSVRTAFKGPGDNYTTGIIDIGRHEGGKQYDRPSTAVEDVKYNPKTRECQVKFVGGDTYYTYANMSKDQFEDFMNSDSKGRYVNKVMHYNNLIPGYVSNRG